MRLCLLVLALFHQVAALGADVRCDIDSSYSAHNIDQILATCQKEATAQGRDQLRSSVTESARQCRNTSAYATDPQAELKRCLSVVVETAREVLTCTASPKRYQEVVEFDVEQSIQRFGEFTFVDVPKHIDLLFLDIASATDLTFVPQFEKPKWNLKAFQHEMANATAGAGGNIFVSTGLWIGSKAFPNDEIAAIFAHEMGHIVKEHSLHLGCQALEWAGAQNTIKEATEIFRDDFADGFPRKEAWKKLSQRLEYEADEVALQILQAAGRDPASMVRALMRLKSQASESGFSSGSHPELSDRIERARKLHRLMRLSRVAEQVK